MPDIDIEELDDEHEQRHDYRRANGAPLVSDPHDETKTLRYSRPSSYAKCLDDESALDNWRMWKAMEGVARSPALQTQVVATKVDDKAEKKALREKALDKGTANEAADQGTGLHAMTARSEDTADIDWDPPEQYVGDLDAYRDALATYGLVSEMVEVHMVNDDFRAAGTADRIYRLTKRLQAPDGSWLEPGELVVGDLKTGKKLDFGMPNYAVQLAIYAQGVLYDIVTERRLPTPPINNSWTLLVHLPVGMGNCKVLWCSIETGVYGAWLAKEVKEWRKLWKNGTHDCPVVPVPFDAVETLQTELGAEVVADVDLLPALTEFAKARIKTIGEDPKAKDTLILRWPADLPSPKKGIDKPYDMIRLLDLLDKIEAQYSIPFLHEDPRAIHQSSGHKSKLRTDNKFMLAD
jgi:hypothetical protein